MAAQPNPNDTLPLVRTEFYRGPGFGFSAGNASAATAGFPIVDYTGQQLYMQMSRWVIGPGLDINAELWSYVGCVTIYVVDGPFVDIKVPLPDATHADSVQDGTLLHPMTADGTHTWSNHVFPPPPPPVPNAPLTVPMGNIHLVRGDGVALLSNGGYTIHNPGPDTVVLVGIGVVSDGQCSGANCIIRMP